MEDDVIELHIEKSLNSANGLLTLQVNTRLKQGELTVLFGDSGAGKTTLLRILSGLTKPDKGYIKAGKTVWFDSDARINLPPQKRNIGFMFQDYALFPNMNVIENILYAQKEKNKVLALDLAKKFGLVELLMQKPDRLSGGQKQRVALARALASKRRILLLDEPLSALDMKMRTLLQDEILKAHKHNGSTTLMVSHDLTEVFRLANHVIKLENGQLRASGRPDNLFLNSQISGKVQITGHIVKIEKQDIFYLLTVVTGMNQIIKVTAFSNDIENLNEGDQVIVFSKAFNPIIMKI